MVFEELLIETEFHNILQWHTYVVAPKALRASRICKEPYIAPILLFQVENSCTFLINCVFLEDINGSLNIEVSTNFSILRDISNGQTRKQVWIYI